jgi:chemotaxis protein methyltransferase CheR
VFENAGISLTQNKQALVVSRLQKQLRKLGLKSFREYYDYVVKEKTGVALADMIDQIATNYTYFNREKEHFDFFLNRGLPDVSAQIRNSKSNDIRIWCAAASTGEEPYMLAMLMREYFGHACIHYDGGLLATDISRKSLSVAKIGVFKNEAVNLLPPLLKNKYFQKGKGFWTICEQIKRDVTFRRFNLVNKEFPFKKRFHIIFCRNVMIYFDQPTREALVQRFSQLMEPGSYLFIGHSETLNGMNTPFRYIKSGVYRKE